MARLLFGLAFALAAQVLSAATPGQIDVRVRQTPVGPRIFVDGKAVVPRFYYGAFGGDTERLQASDPAVPGSGNGSLNGMYSNGAMGVAFLRRDGFVAMAAEPGKTGELLTRPVAYRGNRLFVNASVSGGFVEAEILDEKLGTLATFGKFRGDSTCVELKALSGNLESLAGRPVRFRFRVKGGSLYSFWMSDSPTGRSHGYLAGGGPGYAGLKDE